MNPSSDLELLQQARQSPEGDTRAFEELVRLHHKRILANCRFLTRDDSNYEDLAQEVFVKAYFGLKSFEGTSTFGHWLRRIKVNHCLNHIKRKEGKTALDISDPTLEQDGRLQAPAVAEAALDSAAHSQLIQQVLASLPLTLRVPLVMRDMDGFSYEEAAQSLGIGLSAVKMRIKRGRDEFRRIYTALTNSKDPA